MAVAAPLTAGASGRTPWKQALVLLLTPLLERLSLLKEATVGLMQGHRLLALPLNLAGIREAWWHPWRLVPPLGLRSRGHVGRIEADALIARVVAAHDSVQHILVCGCLQPWVLSWGPRV